jgi:AraC-like DNA-binding protein
MPIIVQLYLLTTFSYIILSQSIARIFSDGLLKIVFLLVAYAGTVRIVLGLNPELPFIMHASVFFAYALFVPGAYLFLRNSILKRGLKEIDLVHIIPFLALCIYSLLAFLLELNIHPELKKAWSFSSREAYDSDVLMPLFLFAYCLTAFYFYQILMLIKSTVFRKTESLHLEPASQPVSEMEAERTEVAPAPLLISQERMAQIDIIVKDMLEEKKPYLQHRYSLRDLAFDTNIPLHHLSAYINKYCGKNFNDFINEFRVMHCKEKLLNEEYKFKKLEAIAEESGFNNRNTFAIAFKKVMGVNPSEFLRSLKSANYTPDNNFDITEAQKYLQRV